MKWIELLNIVDKSPVFSTGFLMTAGTKPENVRLQLSRWVKDDKLIQLCRGIYSVSEPFCKALPHPFLASNVMKKASYISLQSALHYYNLIPEHLNSITGITAGRPGKYSNFFGEFEYRHVKRSWFHSYKKLEIIPGQFALIALPEKALLDLLYLTPYENCYNYLQELRLQNIEQLKINKLIQIISDAEIPKLKRAEKWLIKYIENNKYEEL